MGERRATDQGSPRVKHRRKVTGRHPDTHYYMQLTAVANGLRDASGVAP